MVLDALGQNRAVYFGGAAGAGVSATVQPLPRRPIVRHARRQCDPADYGHGASHPHRSFGDAVSRRARTNTTAANSVVEDTYGTHSVKLPAGHMILYPATSLHHVRPVTRGARLASFFWIQSMVRDDGAADAAVRSGHRRSSGLTGTTGSSVGGAADRRLSQPAAAVGGAVTDRQAYRLSHSGPALVDPLSVCVTIAWQFRTSTMTIS